MGKWIFSFLFLSAAIGSQAFSHGKQLCKGFLPENTMWIPATMVRPQGITQTQFDEILDRLTTLYSPEFQRRGLVFKIERNWTDGTVNAYAYQDGNEAYIAMFGGFARHPAITYDGFSSIACHEIGHHLGGAPKFAPDDWASVEGQSDYYATSKCLKRLWEHEDNDAVLAGMTLDPTAVSQCESEQSSKQDQQLCIRAAMAAVSLGPVLADFEGGGTFKLDTPDRRTVSQTSPDHPAGQCRMDTYFQGGLCRVGHWQAVSDTDPAVGYCYDTRTYTRGLRPRCWYAP